jgi:hypothetical protein
VWFARIKQLFHPFFCIFRHTLKTGMLNPVLGSVFSERKICEAFSGDVLIQVQ